MRAKDGFIAGFTAWRLRKWVKPAAHLYHFVCRKHPHADFSFRVKEQLASRRSTHGCTWDVYLTLINTSVCQDSVRQCASVDHRAETSSWFYAYTCRPGAFILTRVYTYVNKRVKRNLGRSPTSLAFAWSWLLQLRRNPSLTQQTLHFCVHMFR